MHASQRVLSKLLAEAGLPPAVEVSPLEGRGFSNEIVAATLAGGRRVILRRWPAPRLPEHARARFLADHGLPAPGLLAADEHASIIEFVPGEVLGDLIDDGRDSIQVWRLVGQAYRRVHDVAFPGGLTGEVRPHRIVLTPTDPVARLHADIENARIELHRILPERVADLLALHGAVQAAAGPLRAAKTALGHGDIHMWNVLVSASAVTLVDWDSPRVCDPAMEVGLLDKHASLFNGKGLPESFFEGYGHPPTEPNTSVHRVVQTLNWATSSDWAEFEADPGLSDELKRRARTWRPVLVDYLRDLPHHIHRLHMLTRR